MLQAYAEQCQQQEDKQKKKVVCSEPGSEREREREREKENERERKRREREKEGVCGGGVGERFVQRMYFLLEFFLNEIHSQKGTTEPPMDPPRAPMDSGISAYTSQSGT